MPPENQDALLRILDYQRLSPSITRQVIEGMQLTQNVASASLDSLVCTRGSELEVGQTEDDTPSLLYPFPEPPSTSEVAVDDDNHILNWGQETRLSGNSTQQPSLYLPETAQQPSTVRPLTEQPQSISPSSKNTRRDSASTEALVDELSERVGSLQIGPEGHIRYYGPTSNFNLVKMPSLDAFSQHITARHDSNDCLKHLGLDKEIPLGLQDHLINLYFTWQDPAMHVVDRTIFETARDAFDDSRDTPYYSEALYNAM